MEPSSPDVSNELKDLHAFRGSGGKDMGMYGSLRRLTPDQLALLRSNPELTSRFVDPDDDEYGSADWWPNGPVLDLDKSWQVLHFILTGDPWEGQPPLKNAILGGTEIGPDLGYGPARYLTPEEVSIVTGTLAQSDASEARARLDPDALEAAKVYPGAWKPAVPAPKKSFFAKLSGGSKETVAKERGTELAEYFEFVMDRFRALVEFYKDAAHRGNAVLSWIV